MARIRIIVEHGDDCLSADVHPSASTVRSINARGDVCIDQPPVGDALRDALSRLHDDMQHLIASNWPTPGNSCAPEAAPMPTEPVTPSSLARMIQATLDSGHPDTKKLNLIRTLLAAGRDGAVDTVYDSCQHCGYPL